MTEPIAWLNFCTICGWSGGPGSCPKCDGDRGLVGFAPASQLAEATAERDRARAELGEICVAATVRPGETWMGRPSASCDAVSSILNERDMLDSRLAEATAKLEALEAEDVDSCNKIVALQEKLEAAERRGPCLNCEGPFSAHPLKPHPILGWLRPCPGGKNDYFEADSAPLSGPEGVVTQAEHTCASDDGVTCKTCQRDMSAGGDWATEEVTSGESGSFGCDHDDSAALLRLREAIDSAGLWPSDAVREAGDYEAAVEHMAALAGQTIQPYDEWVAQNPRAKAANDLAHGWLADDVQAGGRGMSLEEVLRAYPEATANAMRRMRGAAASYLSEMAQLINDGDYSEILHHAGHVEFEMTSLQRLTRARAGIARSEPALGPDVLEFLAQRPVPTSYSFGRPLGEAEGRAVMRHLAEAFCVPLAIADELEKNR